MYNKSYSDSLLGGKGRTFISILHWFLHNSQIWLKFPTIPTGSSGSRVETKGFTWQWLCDLWVMLKETQVNSSRDSPSHRSLWSCISINKEDTPAFSSWIMHNLVNVHLSSCSSLSWKGQHNFSFAKIPHCCLQSLFLPSQYPLFFLLLFLHYSFFFFNITLSWKFTQQKNHYFKFHAPVFIAAGHWLLCWKSKVTTVSPKGQKLLFFPWETTMGAKVL